MKSVLFYVFAILLISFISCNRNSNNEFVEQEKSSTRFTLLSSDLTNIDFINKLLDSDEVELTYEYRFNGAGVAIGDINNDGLQDIFFTSTNLENKLYLNKGNMVFEDITLAAGILPLGGMSTGVTMVDINCDGLLDIYVCRTGKFPVELRTNLLYINNGDLTFTESAKKYGLDDPGYSNQSAFFDYDNDGDLDMYLINQPIDYTYANTILLFEDTVRTFVSDRLYRNNGDGTFTDVTIQAGVSNKAFGFNASIEDFNNDGYWDIYVSNDYLQPDYLYINNGDGTFSDSFSKYFKHCAHSSMGSVVSDYNNDGHPDVFVLDMMAEDNLRQKLLNGPMDYDDFYLSSSNGAYYQYMRNQLQLNNGNGTFSEIGELAGISNTDWSWGPIMADLDNDGWKDLFIANGYRRDLTDLDYRAYHLDSINQIGGMGIFKSMAEMLNTLPETPVRNYAFRNNKDLTFKDVSDDWGFTQLTFSNGASYADLDNDGDLDIVINNIDQPAMIYRNETAQKFNTNHVTITLKGNGCNTFGVGAKAIVHAEGISQYATYFPTQGFYSSVPNTLHFGLGEQSKADSIEIFWPGKLREVILDVPSGKFLTADITNATPYIKKESPKITPAFVDVTKGSGLNHFYKENDFIDFKREPLLPQKFSEFGPCMAKGDINNNGLEDIFIGGATGEPGVIFTQVSPGKFRKMSTPVLESDKHYEDGAALFFDYDNDGDLDLYVASGGNEWDLLHENYHDRLYINDGKGNFSKAPAGVLPDIKFSTSCVTAADFDGDGDLDLFVGGRIVSWNYPLSPRSYLLINDNGIFRDATHALAPELVKPGLICDAMWIDFNNDNLPDLVVAGQWMAPAFYANTGGKLVKVRDSALDANTGWYNCIVSGDFNGDGKVDFIFGNRGLNSRIKAKHGEPARVYASDYDKNGTLDAIPTYYIQGVSYPSIGRDQLTDQVRPLKKKFLRYKEYASATIYDIFPKAEVDSAYILEATTFASSYIQNLGNNRFEVVELPLQSQFSTITGMVVDDFNNDGFLDVLFAGNDYSNEVITGRYDASIGGILLGDGKGGFRYSHVNEHGFMADGNVRSVLQLKGKGNDLIIVGQNNGPVKVFRRSKFIP